MPTSVLRAVLGRMQFTLHATRRTPHGALRLLQAVPSWLAKTRRAPSVHSRGARVYGHTTTAMHKLPSPPQHGTIVSRVAHTFPRAGAVSPWALPQGKLASNGSDFPRTSVLGLRLVRCLAGCGVEPGLLLLGQHVAVHSFGGGHLATDIPVQRRKNILRRRICF